MSASADTDRVALFRYLPQLALPWVALGDWPTPVDEARIDGKPIWIKREGDSNAQYGGNKVRTLEAWLGHVRASGAERIWAIGAYGSNHAIATAIHARTAGLDAGAIVFPQPASEWAIENAGALIAAGIPIVRLRNVVEVPFAGVAVAVRDRLFTANIADRWTASDIGDRVKSLYAAHVPRKRDDGGGSLDGSRRVMTDAEDARTIGDSRRTLTDRDAAAGASTDIGASRRMLTGTELAAAARALIARLFGADQAKRSIVMPPGGATPIGTLGALSAAFELAEQVTAGIAPPPRRIVLPVGSTCTTAGLLSGFAVARALGVWRWPLPIVHAVRVTPWPVTSRVMITQLAAYTLARIAQLGGPRVDLDGSRLVVDRRELGPGYGRITPRAQAAMTAFANAEWTSGADAPRLDGVYSAKAAAALLRLHRDGEGPLLFWSTKSTVQMDPPSPVAVDRAPRALARWLAS